MLKIALIALVVVVVAAFAIFFWPVPQIVQVVEDARSAEIVDGIVESLENPPTEAPAVIEIQYSPAKGADSYSCPNSNSEIAHNDIPGPILLLGRNVAGTHVFIEAADGHLAWMPIGAVLVNGTDMLEYNQIVDLPLKDEECTETEKDIATGPEQAEPSDQDQSSSKSECPARVEIEPPANAFINADENKTYSFSYVLEEDRPYDIVVPCGSTATIAFGNAKIDGKVYVAGETEGNVVYSTCDEPLGCKYTVIDFTPGHAIVTMTYPGMEKSLDTVYNAVSNMFNPSNCGGSGCLIAFMTDADNPEATATFKSKPAKKDLVVNDFVAVPTIGSVIGEPETKSITVGGKKVGQVYSLESTATQYIGVPEQHDGFVTGLYIECAEGCTVYNIVLKPGQAAEVYGNLGDNNSPNDLNWTVAVQSAEPEAVKIYFIYADDVDNYAHGVAYKFDSNGLIK